MNKSLLLFIFLVSLFATINAQTGVDCATSVTASIGSNAGNGKSSQYFKFTAASTGYLNLSSSSTSYCYTYVYKETCTLSSQVVSGNCYKGSPLLLYVESGSTYFINPYYLNSNSLIIQSTNIVGKEITSSYINMGSDYFYAVVDTVNNSLTFKVPDNADLTNVTFAYERLNIAYTTVTSNGTVVPANGKINLSTLSSMLITAKDGSTATYTINVIKKPGISCSSAIPVTDTIKGNDELFQYYSFTPEITSYYELKTNQNGFSVIGYKGNCGSLTTIADGNVSSSQTIYIYGEAATTYYLRTYNQKSDSLIIKKGTHLPKEFTYIYVSQNNEYYYATIDSVKNTISLDVPSNLDLTSIDFYFYKTGYNYTTVSSSAGDILSGAKMDISNIGSLKITANDGSVATYTFTIKKIEGLNCESAKVITKDTTAGNGFYRQFFSYTPENTKYIKIIPSKSEMSVHLYQGSCSELSSLYDAYIYPENPMELKVEAGIKYTLDVYGLSFNSLIIKDLTSINKDFRSFYLGTSDDNYNAAIDTVKNTLTVVVPSDMDLSSVDYAFSTFGFNLIKVSAGVNVLGSSGTADFSNITTLLVTADDGTTQNYALTIKKVEGMNCSTARTANYGLTTGNGSNNNYFKFTPGESGFVSIYPSNTSSEIEVYSGTCDNLLSVDDHYANVNSPLIVKLEGGKTYFIEANSLYNKDLVLKKTVSISKEFNYFQIYDGLNYFSAKIDTSANTLNFTIPSDLNLSALDLQFNTTSQANNVVSIDGKTLSSYGSKINLSSAPNITITAKDGSTAVYTTILDKNSSISCASSTEIAEGTITGNGKTIQYFTFTPSLKGYVKISTADNFYASLHKGDCGSFTKIGDRWMGDGSDLILPIEQGIKYTLLTRSQYADKFAFAYLRKIDMDFSYFRLRDNTFTNVYYADIDTVLNKITFKVPAGFNKADLFTEYQFLGNQSLTVTANKNPVENQEYFSYTNISTLTLTGPNNVSVTYSLVFAETPGASCQTASAITEGTTTGNGASTQYFTFVPSKSGYIKISALDNYFYASITAGTCSNLNSVDDYSVGPGYPRVFKVEKDKSYVIAIENLLKYRINLSYINSVSKEIVYASLFDGAAVYYGTVDTTANTISFTVSAGLDLSLVNYSFDLEDANNTHIVIGNDSVASDGIRNLSNLNSLTIKGNNGTSTTYTISFKTTNAVLYRVSAGCGENGTISPRGIMSVEKGTNLVFTITPKTGYGIKELYVDDALVTPATTYTISNISDEHYIEVSFHNTTSVKSIFDFAVNVYPNPFKNYFTVEAESGTLFTIYNAQGTRILENIMENNSRTINLSGYPQGLYIIEIRKGNKAERYKAIKQ